MSKVSSDPFTFLTPIRCDISEGAVADIQAQFLREYKLVVVGGGGEWFLKLGCCAVKEGTADRVASPTRLRGLKGHDV
jgi:hypothetical protein